MALLAICVAALVMLLAGGDARPSGSAVAAGVPTLSVDAAAGEQPISPLIYGVNFADDQASAAEAASIGLPINRWGGNTTDTYNWHLGSSNTGADYYYENVADCWSSADNYCNGGQGPNTSGYQAFIDGNRSIGAQTLLTLPLMGYVAKDAPLEQPLTCSFPVSTLGAQDSTDPYDNNCGNGQHNGSDLTSDPTTAGVAINPADNASAWVDALVARYGTAANGGVGYYELGNEPALWDSTHRDMHPAATTYDELWQKSEATAVAVKTADPSAKVLAFSEWGWPNYTCSADDGDECTASSPDRAAHGGLPIVEYLLSQAHAYDQAHSGRLFDYLDLHYYRQGGETTDVTRSLWDPTYTDPSWIDTPIDLIPRMRAWVADEDPGIGLSLSEYNLSIDSDQTGYAVTNAIIQADTLGIFAREGLGIATRWALDNDGPDIIDAYDMYRDYDGHGSRFGDTYVQSASSDQSALAVYGATRSSDGALTVMVINKSSSGLTSPLALSGFQPAGTAQKWQWTGGSVTREADQAVTASGLTATYPADSITLLVIPPAGSSVTTTTTASTTTTTTSHPTTTTTYATTTATGAAPSPGAAATTVGTTVAGTSSSTSTSVLTSTSATGFSPGDAVSKDRTPAKPLTKAQVLVRELVACHRLPGSARRARCEAVVRRRIRRLERSQRHENSRR